jgi:hypothetical protein
MPNNGGLGRTFCQKGVRSTAVEQRRITTTVSDMSGTITSLPGGVLWPGGAEVSVFVGDAPAVVAALTLRVVDGRPVLTGIDVRQIAPDWPRPAEVTNDDLRNLLPLEELVEEAVRSVAVVCAMKAPRKPDTEDPSASRKRRGPQTPEFLQYVSYVVRSNPNTPMRTLARDHLGTSERTAWRWVTEARRQGLLPDTATSKKRRADGGLEAVRQYRSAVEQMTEKETEESR